MSNDLSYSVGVDPTDLDTGVALVEARLEASGVRMSQVPQKYAKASFEAFDQIAAAEDKLAKYREEIAFKRLSSEEKLAVLQAQALGLMEQIGMAEFDSAKQAELQLAFEQKKTAIYELNQKITAEQTAALAVQTVTHKEHEGLMGSIEGWSEKIKKGFHEMGISLHGAGIGLILAEVVMLTKEAINEAQQQRDEYEKIGKPLQENTKALALFGDGLDQVKHAAVSAVGAVVGWFAQIGARAGEAIGEMQGVSKAQQAANEASQRAADIATARVLKLKEEQHDTEKIAAARKDLAEAEKKAAFDRATDEQKVGILFAERLKLMDQIAATEKGTVAWFERKKQLLENEIELRKQDAEVVKKIAEIEMDRIKSASALDITYQEKRLSIEKEVGVLQRELAQLQKGTVDYKKVENDLREKGIELQKLDREWRKSAALDHEQLVELAQLELKARQGLTGEERLRLELLILQAQEKKVQYQIDELIEKKLTVGLTPAEKERLKLLFKQEEKLQDQIKEKANLIGVIEAEKSAEEGVTDEIKKQQAEQEALKNKIEEATKAFQTQSAVLSGLHDLENLSTDVLAAKRKKLQDDMDAFRAKWMPTFGVPFIEGDVNYLALKNQISSIDRETSRRNLLLNANNTGGRQGALDAFVKAGYEPLAFDTVYNQLDNWTKGQTETNQQLATATKGIAGIDSKLAQILQ